MRYHAESVLDADMGDRPPVLFRVRQRSSAAGTNALLGKPIAENPGRVPGPGDREAARQEAVACREWSAGSGSPCPAMTTGKRQKPTCVAVCVENVGGGKLGGLATGGAGLWTASGLHWAMIRIAITIEAFDAIAATLPLGSVGYENEINERGERLIWLDHGVVARLRAMRGPGESDSDVIVRLAAAAGGKIEWVTP